MLAAADTKTSSEVIKQRKGEVVSIVRQENLWDRIKSVETQLSE